MGIFGRRKGAAPTYDTPLTPEQEAAFRQQFPDWQQATQDYDLRGAWAGNAQQANNGHLPDTWKKPNHITFSDESQYNDPANPGGHWSPAGNDKWAFWASQQNLNNTPLEALADYFRRAEPGNTMIAPISFDLRNLRNAPRKR